MANGSLEHDHGVSLVVSVTRVGLAVGAEVSVVADGALVTNAADVGRVRFIACT